MIKSQAAHRRLRDTPAQRKLAALTVRQSIAIGEALLTSGIMQHMRPSQERHLDLARTLGIRPERLRPTRRPR